MGLYYIGMWCSYVACLTAVRITRYTWAGLGVNGASIYPACNTSLAVGDIRDVLVNSANVNGVSNYYNSMR